MPSAASIAPRYTAAAVKGTITWPMIPLIPDQAETVARVAVDRRAGGRARAGLPVYMPPEVRRFVAAYARRRAAQSLEERLRLAEEACPALESVMPDLARTEGPLAALDRLAEAVR